VRAAATLVRVQASPELVTGTSRRGGAPRLQGSRRAVVALRDAVAQVSGRSPRGKGFAFRLRLEAFGALILAKK